MPTIKAHHIYGINHRMLLETLQCVYENRLVIYIYKLFGDVLPHTIAGSSGYNQRNIHKTNSIS